MKIAEHAKNHMVDSTAFLAASTPIFASLENMVLGMPDEVSINARLIAAGVTYAGFGFLITKSRDLYRKTFKITDKTKESKQQIHDSIYAGLFNILVSPPLYYFSGAQDIEQIIGGTAIGVGFGLLCGSLIGYSIDAFRDLTGTKESARVPRCIRNKSSNVKLGIAALITATSIAFTGAVYKITPDKGINKNETAVIYQEHGKNINKYATK